MLVMFKGRANNNASATLKVLQYVTYVNTFLKCRS